MEELSELFSRGQRLGKYQLIRRLAVGGMAEIYLAQASGLEGFEKLVVLKRILPQHALDPQLRRMFLDEARLMAALTHPHITQVYDVGAEGDAPFFAMEYVHGANLREIMNAAGRAAGLDHQPLAIPLTHAIGILAAAAAGLHFAHEQIGSKGEPLHIVHRDVSPSNVLVTYGGSVKVSDFGIAKWSSQRTQTQEGALKGKFAYMSPEQCRGQPLDRRSDVFALGTLLYELTTGQPPFRAASDYEILNRIVNGELPAPVMADGPYPAELERIVRRALALLPDDRYPTAQALQLDLEAFARAHGLVLSTVGLGEYMHALFAQRIADWQRAQQSGKSLKQHLAEIEAASARLEPSSRPTATDLHALSPAQTRRRRSGKVPAIVAAGLALALAGGIPIAMQSRRRGPHADSSARGGGAAASAIAATTPARTTSSPAEGGAVPTAAGVSAKPSTGSGRGNTVDSHPAPSPAPTAAKPRHAARARAEGVGPDLATATSVADPDPVPPAANPTPTPAADAVVPAARTKALKNWDPDSPLPP